MKALECLLAKSEFGRVSKKSLDRVQQRIQELKNTTISDPDKAAAFKSELDNLMKREKELQPLAERGEHADSVLEEVQTLLKSYDEDAANKLTELQKLNKVYEIMKNRLDQRASEIVMHAERLTEIERRAKLPHMNVKQLGESFFLTEDAAAIKHGYYGASVNEAIENNRRMMRSLVGKHLDVDKPEVVAILRDPEKSKELIQDLFAKFRNEEGRSSNTTIRKLSDGLADIDDLGGRKFIEAGGALTLRKDHLIGRKVDDLKIGKYTQDEYVKDGLEAFDLARTRESSGGIVSTPEQLAQALRSDYQAVVSGGLVDTPDFVPKGMRSVVNSRNYSRLFHFKDAGSYTKWHEKYGKTNIFEGIQAYVNNVGKDIGVLETLGPKPEAFFRALLRKMAKINGPEAKKFEPWARKQFMFQTGQWDRSKSAAIENILSNARNLTIAAKQGTTVLDAAVVDGFALPMLNKALRGQPALKYIGGWIKTAFTMNKLTKREWTELGLYNDSFMDSAAQSVMRMGEEAGGKGITSKMANGVLKYTGLNWITDAQKGWSMMMLARDFAHMKLGDFPPAQKAYFKSLGLTDDVLKVVQDNAVDTVNGVKVVNAFDLWDKGFKKEAQIINTIFGKAKEYNSPTSSARFRAVFEDLQRSNPVSQVVAGSQKIFTGYLGSYIENIFKMAMAVPGPQKLKFVGAFALAMMPMGVISVMVRDILNGKNPSFDEDTVKKAFVRVMSLPFIDVFIRTGGNFDSVSSSMLGPVLSDVDKLAEGVGKAVSGDVTGGVNTAKRAVESNIPGKTIFYLKLALQRMLFDQMAFLYDHDAEKKFRKQTRKAANEGTPFWWRPGQMEPDGPPDLSNIEKQPFFKKETKR